MMLERSKTALVLWPETFIAVASGIGSARGKAAGGAGNVGAGRFRYSDLNEAARICGYTGFRSRTELGGPQEFELRVVVGGSEVEVSRYCRVITTGRHFEALPTRKLNYI